MEMDGVRSAEEGRGRHEEKGRAMRRTWTRFAGAAAAALALGATACSSPGATTANAATKCDPKATPVVTLAAYSTVYDVYGKLISAFQDQWKADHKGQQVIFQTSFGGSTTQAQ